MEKSKASAFAKCIIMLLIAIGWCVISVIYCSNPTQHIIVKILVVIATVGWLAIFIIRVIQWIKLVRTR